MDPYQNWARSNYFRVKDPAAFAAWCEQHELEVITKGDLDGGDGRGPFVGFSHRGSGAFSFEYWVDDAYGIPTLKDRMDDLAAMLVDGDVAIVLEAGWNPARFVVGTAIAINSCGEREFLELYHIYDQAKHLGRVITLAEY